MGLTLQGESGGQLPAWCHPWVQRQWGCSGVGRSGQHSSPIPRHPRLCGAAHQDQNYYFFFFLQSKAVFSMRNLLVHWGLGPNLPQLRAPGHGELCMGLDPACGELRLRGAGAGLSGSAASRWRGDNTSPAHR